MQLVFLLIAENQRRRVDVFLLEFFGFVAELARIFAGKETQLSHSEVLVLRLCETTSV